MIGIGEIFSLSCALCWAISVISFRKVGTVLSPFSTNFFKNTFSAVLMLPTIFLIDGLGLPSFEPSDLLILVISGIFGIAIADTLYFKALNLLGAGRTGITGSTFSPFVIILSVIFLNERLSLLQIMGFLSIISGVLLVTYQRKTKLEIPKPLLIKGIIIGIAAQFFMAIGIVMAKPVLSNASFLWVVEIRVLAGLAGMMLLTILQRRGKSLIASFQVGIDWKHLIFASLLGTYISTLLWLAGYKYTSASIASILNETSSIWIILLAWLWLKEPLTSRKLLGCLCAFGGILFIAFGKT